MTCGILVSRPGIEPGPRAVEAWHLNRWTASHRFCRWRSRVLKGMKGKGSVPVIFQGKLQEAVTHFPLARAGSLTLFCSYI